MKNLNYELKNSIAFVRFNRPAALNALNSETFADLNEVLDELEKVDQLTAIVLTGEGKAFIAGADIAQMKNMTPEEAANFSLIGHDTFNRLENFPVPVIAAVNGFALGGGLELCMACDFRIASEKAKFSAPEVNLGLIPGFAGTQRLQQLVGPGMAKFLLFTANMVDANEALRIGLVQAVYPLDELENEVIKIANTITAKGPKAIRSAKKVANEGLINGFTAGAQMEIDAFSKLFEDEGKEGMAAFLEKREPKW